MLKVWDQAPGFSLLNDKEEKRALGDFIGKYKIVYFYPKANTSGCTTEAVGFSENLDDLLNFELQYGDEGSRIKFEVPVIGISPDKTSTLANFREKHDLKVDLLSDRDREVARSYGALKENGKSILRSTFIIDRWGRVRKAWYGVRVKGHVEEVIDSLSEVISNDLEVNPQISYRRAKRALSTEPISREEIENLLKAAHLAPSCMNKQPWRFTVVDESETLNNLHGALSGGNYWMKKAPVIIAVHSRKSMDCALSDNRDYYLFDSGLTTGFLMLQATQMGMIAHPVAGYDPVKTKEVLGIPEENVLITLVALGYPGDMEGLGEKHQEDEQSPRDRLPLEEVVEWK